MKLKDIQQFVTSTQQIVIASNRATNEHTLVMADYNGIVNYYPDELILTVKAGTKISDINKVLQQNNQSFTFVADDTKTIGSIYALGGSNVRAHVLGVEIVDGNGNYLKFGGQVMKNVAGYDVSRMLVGSRGLFAVICQISFKVIPKKYLNTKQSQSKKTISPENMALIQRLKTVFDPYNKFNNAN